MMAALRKRFNEKKDTTKVKAHITSHTRRDRAALVPRAKKGD